MLCVANFFHFTDVIDIIVTERKLINLIRDENQHYTLVSSSLVTMCTCGLSSDSWVTLAHVSERKTMTEPHTLSQLAVHSMSMASMEIFGICVPYCP